MISEKLKFRRATINDARLIASLGARTFETSFGADNRPEDMEQYLFSNFSKTNIGTQLSDPSTTFLLAYENCSAVGYAMLRVGKKPVSVDGPKPVELVRIYLEEEFIGKGLFHYSHTSLPYICYFMGFLFGIKSIELN